MAFDQDRLPHRGHYSGGDSFRFGGFAEVRRDDVEFIAADSRHRIPGAQYAAHARGDFAEKQIPDAMAGRIVDPLETVEIDEQNRETLAPRFGFAQRTMDAFGEQKPVGKAGQAVMTRVKIQTVVKAAVFDGHLRHAFADGQCFRGRGGLLARGAGGPAQQHHTERSVRTADGARADEAGRHAAELRCKRTPGRIVPRIVI